VEGRFRLHEAVGDESALTCFTLKTIFLADAWSASGGRAEAEAEKLVFRGSSGTRRHGSRFIG